MVTIIRRSLQGLRLGLGCYDSLFYYLCGKIFATPFCFPQWRHTALNRETCSANHFLVHISCEPKKIKNIGQIKVCIHCRLFCPSACFTYEVSASGSRTCRCICSSDRKIIFLCQIPMSKKINLSLPGIIWNTWANGRLNRPPWKSSFQLKKKRNNQVVVMAVVAEVSSSRYCFGTNTEIGVVSNQSYFE